MALRLLLLLIVTLVPAAALAESEDYLRLSTKVFLDGDRSDLGTDLNTKRSMPSLERWIDDMGQRMVRLVPNDSVMRNEKVREDFLATVYYESARAGLDPQWVLALIQVESAFRKYAISTVGARGYMQVMPFWTGLIGEDEHNLFHLRTNLRYGTVILRHYLNIEDGDLYRALGRYNGSLGKRAYPMLVLDAYEKHWSIPPT